MADEKTTNGEPTEVVAASAPEGPTAPGEAQDEAATEQGSPKTDESTMDLPAAEPPDEPSERTDEPAPDEPAQQPAAAAETAPASDEPAEQPAAEAESAPAPEPEAEQVPEGEPVAQTTEQESEGAAELTAPEQPAAAGVAAPEPAAPKEPKRKKKRVPRALRPARTKERREQSTERKPIVRLPKPEGERGRRQERRGVVVSSAPDKTIVVKVDTVKAHRRYKKVVRRSRKFHAHDEANSAKVGDVVRIVETRPVSKLKRWRLAEVLEEAR